MRSVFHPYFSRYPSMMAATVVRPMTVLFPRIRQIRDTSAEQCGNSVDCTWLICVEIKNKQKHIPNIHVLSTVLRRCYL